MTDFNRYIVDERTSIKEALRRLNELSGDVMTLLVVDSQGRMSGTLTDGDVRRAIISGAKLDTPVKEMMHRDFKYISDENGHHQALRPLREIGIKLLPVLDSSRKITRVIDLRRTKAILPVSALIMAGGKGERLRPLTLTTPKPLLEIGGKPIIDYNIEALAAVGIDDIKVSVNYLADKLESHFSGSKVVCVRETYPLGTIGALAEIENFRYDTVLVMNSDLLTDISFEDMYYKHMAEGADITIAATPYTQAVPYAILQTEGDRVVALEEKPVYSYYANAGIYMISANAMKLMEKGQRTDATDLIETAINSGLKVIYFPITGTWIDIGSPADFSHACDLMKYHQQK